MLYGHVPSPVAQLTAKGRLPATTQLSLAIGLPLRNQAALDDLLEQIYDPQSASFHKFLTTPEFTARFGPTEQDYQAVRRFAEANGLAVTGTHANRLVLDVAGSASNVEQAFHVTLRTYRHPTEARDFFAPDTEPSVPADLPVADMWGLTDYGLPKPLSHKVDPLKATPSNYNGSGPGGSYRGGDFRNAYVPGAGLTGSGQIAAVAEFDGYYANDITGYESQCGYAHVPLQDVLLDGVSGTPGYSGAANAVAEVSLDIELLIAMAPGLSTLIVYEGSSPYDVFNRIVTDNLAKQVSCSWSWSVGPARNWGHPGTKTLDSQLQQMAAQGQTFFQASGDSDAYTGSQALSSASGPIPVDSIFVTSVGGTILSMNGAGASWSSETVWNWGGNTGSGGGVSPNYAIPGWQAQVDMSANNGSTVNRNIPDVALTADGVYVVHDNGVTGAFGGTSCAAPLWAGFCALVNQQSLATGGTTVGFLNPALYAIGAGSNYSNCFHDITTGNNVGTNTPGLFNAVANYDLCTGLGTPNGTNLINALAPLASPYFIAQPSSQTVTNGADLAFTATVGGQSPLNYQWLFNGTILAAGGNVAGTTSNVLSITAATTNNAGNYNLVAANSYGSVTSHVSTLTVVLPPAITSSSLTNQTVECGNNNVRFAVAVSGTAPLTFQWSFDGTPIPGATNTSLSLTNVHLPNHTVTFVVTNPYGSLASNAVLTVHDTIAPVITLNGGNPMFAELGGVFIDPGATAYDACAGTVGVAASGAVNSSVLGTNLLVYTSDDGNGNTNTATRTVIVRDTTPPTILWSFTNLVLAADNTCGAQLPDVTGTNFILAADRSGALAISQSPTNAAPLPLGTNVVVITVRDASGNAAYSTNTVVVRDQTPPVITLNGGNPMFAELGGVFIDPGATAYDACAGTVAVAVSGAVNSSVLGTNLLVYTSDDGNGNTNTATRTVIVRDTTPPTILWSFTNLVLAADNTCSAQLPDVTGTNFILAANRSGALAISQSPTNAAPLPLGTNVIVITVRDGSGNAAYSTNTVVVRDQTPPVITLNGGNPMFAELGGVFIDPGATAYDACAGTVAVAVSGAVNSSVLGTNLLIYTSDNGNGNTNTATRTVIVRDTTPPTILWSFTNLVLAADNTCGAQLPDVTGTNFILAADRSGALAISQSPTNAAPLPLGTNVVVITVRDASGNAAYSTNTVVVRDQTPPVITLNGGNPMFAELGGVFIDPGATAYDACAGTVAVAVSGAVNSSVLGTNLLVYTSDDGNGNTNTATRAVIVRDTTPPTILWSFTNLVLAADNTCSAQLPDVTGTNFILAADRSGALAISQSPTNAAPLPLGTNVIVITVRDGSGNAAYSTNTVVVRDQTPPVITLNGGNPMFAELGGVFIDPGATAYDACAGTVGVAVSGAVNSSVLGTNLLVYTSDNGNGNTNTATRTVIVRDTTPPTILWSFTNLVLAADNTCGAQLPDVTGTNFIFAADRSGALAISQSPTNNTPLPLGTNVVVITVQDGSGNAAYSTNTVVVRDQTPPVITLNGGNPMFAELGGVFIDPGATAYDACAGTVAVAVSGTVNSSVLGTNLLVYTSDDGNGNTSTATRTVIVRDTTPPTILWSFTNLVLAADNTCGAQLPDVTGTNFILAADLSGALAISQSPTNAAPLPLGTNVVVITVQDGSGNAAYSTNTVVVRDQTPPVITLNGGNPMFAELGGVFIDPGATAYDACAGRVAVAVSGAVNSSVLGTNLLVYTSDDGNGNTNTATRTVIVRDTTPPTIFWSFTNLVLAADNTCSAQLPDVTGTNFILAADRSGALAISQSPTNAAPLPLGTNVVVITVQDGSGNAACSTNTIVVQDQTPPAILSQPQTQTAIAGTTANFRATATACTPLAYQWFFNSAVLLTNQTNSSLTIGPVSAANAGDYSVIVRSSGGSSTSVVATLTVNSISTSVALNSSTNPCGYKDALRFSAGVAPANATGAVQFLTNGVPFDAEPLVAGQAVSTNLASLPRGTNLITAIYSGDANDLPATNTLLQIVTNHPPMAAAALYSRVAGFPLNMVVADLATNWTDVDGDAISLAQVGISTNGVTLTNNAGTLAYWNSNNVADQFVCVISDGWGGTNCQTVNIAILPAPSIAGIASNPGGGFNLKLAGAPGCTYVLETTTKLLSSANWLPVATNTLGASGVWQFNDAQATNFQQRFYRLTLVP